MEDSRMSEIERRLRAMVAEANIGLDATSKSLRGYTTCAHPMILERLRQHFPDLGRYRSTVGNTFTYETGCTGLSGSRLLNSALQSFYEQEVTSQSEAIIVYPKISKSTLTESSADEGVMRLEVENWVGNNSSLSSGVTGLRQLAHEELGEHQAKDLLDDFANSKLALGIMQFLLTHNWTFPAHLHVEVEGRESPIGRLTMKSKYYIGRDDNRAYCQDKHRLRLLVGACLHRLILVKNLSVRESLYVSTVIRARDKDKLFLQAPLAREGYTTLLITGDISNFTGSFANSWLLLFAAGLDLSRSLERKYTLFSIGGSILYATWFEVIAIYLYLTVGADCYIEDLKRFDYLPGGFLGVTANITSGLLCLSLIMIDLTQRILPKVLNIQSQAGGDDFAYLLVVRNGTEGEIASLIKRDMQKHIGLLKEFKVLKLDSLDEGVLEEARFCRKRITLRRSDSHTIVGCEPSCPLPEILLPFNKLKRKDLVLKGWRELDLGLKKYEEECPQTGRICDSLRFIFLDRYPDLAPTRTCVSRYWPVNGLSGAVHCGYLVSDEVRRRVESVQRVDIHPTYALVSFGERLRFLQVNQVVFSYTVWYKGSVMTCYILDEECGLLEVERREERVSLIAKKELVDRLLKIIG